MRIGANAGEGEFAHVGLGDDHRAGHAQALDHRRIGRGDVSLLHKHTGAGPRHLALHVVEVLDADDDPVERTERLARLDPCVGGIRRSARGIGIDREAGALAFAGRIGNAIQGLFETIAGRLTHGV